MKTLNTAFTLRTLFSLSAIFTLTGCMDESTSMPISGSAHAMTINVRQPLPWSKEFELDVIMARMPDCQRRSRLDNVPTGDVRIDVFNPAEEVFAEPILIIKQGNISYAVSKQNCEMQRFKTEPKEPGTKLGSFERLGSGPLKFVAALPLAKPVASSPVLATEPATDTDPAAAANPVSVEPATAPSSVVPATSPRPEPQ